MVKKPSKRAWKWILAGLGVAIVAFIGVRYAIKKRNALPQGIASGNGRIEGKLVDVAAKEPLRVKEVLVEPSSLNEAAAPDVDLHFEEPPARME